jgi:hypothetical protein
MYVALPVRMRLGVYRSIAASYRTRSGAATFVRDNLAEALVTG